MFCSIDTHTFVLLARHFMRRGAFDGDPLALIAEKNPNFISLHANIVSKVELQSEIRVSSSAIRSGFIRSGGYPKRENTKYE